MNLNTNISLSFFTIQCYGALPEEDNTRTKLGPRNISGWGCSFQLVLFTTEDVMVTDNHRA